MTKQSIISNLKNISDSCQADGTITLFNINDTEKKWFFVRISIGTKYCGTIYCECIKTDDNSDLIQFINDGKIISIFDYLSIDEIGLLYL